MRMTIFVLACVVSSCAHHAVTSMGPLTEAGEAIRVIARPAEVENCSFLGYVGTNQAGDNYIDFGVLIRHGTIDLRNQAAQLGATHLVLEPPTVAQSSIAQTAQAFRCQAPKEK